MMGSVLLLIGNLLEIITTPATFILAMTYGPIVLNEIVLTAIFLRLYKLFFYI